VGSGEISQNLRGWTMKLPQTVSSTFQGVAKTVQGVARFAKLERVLASICLLIPAFLIGFDDGPIRDSISAYYDMEESQVFYFPLTMAAMLFVVNGVVKQQRIYNTILGVMLAGVILFNHDDFNTLHNIFAIAFFAGNAVVILAFSSKKELWFKALLVAGIALSMLGLVLFDWLTLFWAEWLSFAIIALHYILESWGLID
jgi:uncharacterized membrane protein